MSTLSSRNNQQNIYENLPSSYDESQASAGIPIVKQIEMIIEEIIAFSDTFNKQKKHHINEISLYQTTFEKQNQEIKENHANEISLYRELINIKTNAITTLMSTIENYKKEVKRIEEIRKNHEYEYSERLKEKDKILKHKKEIYKHEKEKRERIYKCEIDLMQQTINHLEQTIRDLQTQLRNYEN
ncbi:3337_t:CDS:2, partial [Cetraspora pellucida]